MARKVTTRSGFECEVDENVLNDMEIIDLALEADEDEQNQLIIYGKLIRKILPEDTKKRLYEHIRDESGRVPPDALLAELTDMFNDINKKK